MTRKAALHFIDPCSRQRADLARIAFAMGHHAEVYSDMEELSAHPPRDGIIIARDTAIDGGVPMILEALDGLSVWLPLIAVDAQPRPGKIVAAIKAGALDYLSLPLESDRFARCLARVDQEAETFGATRRRMICARDRIATLSTREREVLDWLARGGSNKTIARELSISPRTVEIHRANMMSKLGARHAAEAVRLRLEAAIETGARS